MERLKTIKTNLEQRMSSIYDSTNIHNQSFFVNSKGIPFHICAVGTDALVIEYADTLEDGDLFYTDEMSEDEIYDAMIKEIEDEVR